MLLLLLQYFSHALSELFDIRQGVAMNPVKSTPDEKKQYIYKVVNLADLSKSFKHLDINTLGGYSSPREIPEDKLLTKEDYIISSKGVLKGFSMQFSNIEGDKQDKSDFKGVIASNNFIILRPQRSTRELFEDIFYLHNLLDLVIMKIRDETKSKNNYLTISKLKKIAVEVPLGAAPEKIKEFEKAFRPWKQNLDAFIEADRILEMYNNLLMKELKIKNIPS